MKIICLQADSAGCYTYRLRIPLDSLSSIEGDSVTWEAYPELPNNPWGNDFETLLRVLNDYDLVIVQRCYKYNVMAKVKRACDLLNKPLIFEVDDDYLNLPPKNPALVDLIKPEVRAGYQELLRMPDLITVSTEELRRSLWSYNKNIVVLPNNIERVFKYKALDIERPDPNNSGKLLARVEHGMHMVPGYCDLSKLKKGNHRVVRIGYSGTPTHRDDFETIYPALEKFLKKYPADVWMVYIGDPYFYDRTVEFRRLGRVHWIPATYDYYLYLYHIRNIDIGIAPLLPNIFNMSKSPIKAIEYASWGTPSILPNYITYNREFTHGENALMYNNEKEFYESLESLVHDGNLRTKIGDAAKSHVEANRLQKLHSKERYLIYKNLIDNKTKNLSFLPKGE